MNVPEISLSARKIRPIFDEAHTSHLQLQLRMNLGSKDLIVAACVEWVPIGNEHSIRIIWTDF